MRVITGILLVLIAAILVWPILLSAGQESADNMQFVIEKIRADKKLFVAENMQLTKSEAKNFWPLYEQYQNELFLLRARTMRLIDDYATAYEKMTDPIARRLLDEYMAIESLGPALRQAYLPQFRQALPDAKVLRYYQIENKINAALIYELAGGIPLINTVSEVSK